MWILLSPPPAPDALVWPGRRSLAAVDAALWPAALLLLLWRATGTGLVLPVLSALLVLVAVSRVRTALTRNHRYQFTTWRLARVLAVLLLLGVALKVGLPGG